MAACKKNTFHTAWSYPWDEPTQDQKDMGGGINLSPLIFGALPKR